MIAYDAYLKTLFKYLLESRIKAYLFAKMAVRLPIYYNMKTGEKKKLRLEYFDNTTKPPPDKFLTEPAGFPAEYKKENVKTSDDVASAIKDLQEEYYEAQDEFENAQFKVGDWEKVVEFAGGPNDKSPNHPGSANSIPANVTTENGKYFLDYAYAAGHSWAQIDEAWDNDDKILEYPRKYYIDFIGELRNLIEDNTIMGPDGLIDRGPEMEEEFKKKCNVMTHIRFTPLKYIYQKKGGKFQSAALGSTGDGSPGDMPDFDEGKRSLESHILDAIGGSDLTGWETRSAETLKKCKNHLAYLRDEYLTKPKQEVKTRLEYLQYAAALYGASIGVEGFYNGLKQGIYNEETKENTAPERLYLFAAYALIEDVDGIDTKVPELPDNASEEEKEENREAAKEVFRTAGRLKLQQIFDDVFNQNFNTINSSNLLSIGQEKMEKHIGALGTIVGAENEWDFLRKNAAVDIKYYNKLIDSMLYESIKTLE